MVHVAKHHKVSRTCSLHAIQSHRQIPIAPVDMGLLPITTAEAVRSRPQPRRTGMGQHDQRPMLGSLLGRIDDPVGRLLFSDWPEHRLHSLRQVKSTSCTARPGTNHRQRRLAPCSQLPWTVPVSQHRDLPLQQISASVTSTVMISKQDRHRQGQLGDALDQAQVSITEISHKKECIRLQSLNQIHIPCPPVTMEVSGNGNTE